MQEVLILKMGGTFPDTANRIGDFDRWIRESVPEELRSYLAVSHKDKPFPDPMSLRGVIISGSHSMVTRPNAWERKAMHWMRWALDAGTPVLGICYGHQMLAHLLGGSVGYLPEGPEIGFQRLRFTGNYESDPLFGLYPSHFETFTYHYQSILRLPPGVSVYARSAREKSHAVRFREWVWGIQYHPEFHTQAITEYLTHDVIELERMGYDPGLLLREAEIERPPDPIIPRFVDLVLSRG